MLLASCATDIGEVKPGEIKHMPFTSSCVVGTDSAFVIINCESGKTLNIIYRK